MNEAIRERLYMLAEEAGEIVQAATKILRHGWEETHPDNINTIRNNQSDLEKEIGDLLGIMDQIVKDGDIRITRITQSRMSKWNKALRYTHHQQATN